MRTTIPPDPLVRRATAMQKRLTEILALYGTEIAYSGSANALTVDVPARIAVLTNATKFSRFREDETTLWELPALSITMAGDFRPFGTEPTAGDTLTVPGETVPFTVRKCEKVRLAGVVVRTLLYAAR
jgi:hypothetical protein